MASGAIGVLTVPLHRAFGQTKGRAVVGDDRPILAERFHHGMPGEQAGPKAMQQYEDRFTLPDDFVMDIDAVDLDKTAVRIGKFCGGTVPQWRNRDEEWSNQQDQ